MYLPAHFDEKRPEILLKTMRENSFATVVSAAGDSPFVSHVPVLVDGASMAGGLKIRGHIAHANPHWRQLATGAPVLAIFHGPHGYVSPSWYASSTGNVPTWNYVVVHAYGRAAPLAPEALRTLLRELVVAHERPLERPWPFESLPPDQLDDLLRAVVGFEIAVEWLGGKLKLSQNRSPDDQRRVRDQLAASRDPVARDLAAWMELLSR